MYFTLFDNHSESIQFTIYIVCPKCRLKVRIFQWTFVLPFQKKWRVIFLGFLLFGIENHEISPKFEHSLPAEFLNLESMVEGIAQIWNLEPLLTVIVRGMEERCHVASWLCVAGMEFWVFLTMSWSYLFSWAKSIYISSHPTSCQVTILVLEHSARVARPIMTTSEKGITDNENKR
jgi:hypothetical protein